MRDLAKSGMTMIVVTHEMQFAREVGDRLLFMDEGKIKGNPVELDSPKQERTKQFLRRSPDGAFIGRIGDHTRRRGGMKRLAILIVVFGLATAAAATFGSAAPTGKAGTEALPASQSSSLCRLR